MHRPEIELFEARARGEYGANWVMTMQHVGMPQLLSYVKELEQSKFCNCKE